MALIPNLCQYLLLARAEVRFSPPSHTDILLRQLPKFEAYFHQQWWETKYGIYKVSPDVNSDVFFDVLMFGVTRFSVALRGWNAREPRLSVFGLARPVPEAKTLWFFWRHPFFSQYYYFRITDIKTRDNIFMLYPKLFSRILLERTKLEQRVIAIVVDSSSTVKLGPSTIPLSMTRVRLITSW